MDTPPPPYSEQNPNDAYRQTTLIKRKCVPKPDTKTVNHAGHGYEDHSDKGFPNRFRSDVDGIASNRSQKVYPEDKVSSDEDSFDIDDYYAGETAAEVEYPNVEKEDTKRPLRPGLSLETLNIASRTHSSPGQLQRDGTVSSPAPSFLSATGSAVTLPLTPDSSSSNTSSAAKAFRDARHFAGGIIQRPYESTKHITIVRHSHGLVFYQGGSTHVAITIFSDRPIPEGRRLWLQKKGWTGKTGTRIDVTPKSEAKVEVHQLNESDERAWQRDITMFGKRGPARIREKHIPRETHIIGLSEAGDGYFLIVLCLGDKKKVLCQSPVFRILSTSTRPACVKGAPIWAIPLEMGFKAGATALNLYAKNTVGR